LRRPLRPYQVALTSALLWAIACVPLTAQDAHYWTTQFGARSDLLGGLVVGDVNDPSAAFYNPGGLGLVDQPAFQLAANGFQHTWITIQGLVTQPDLTSRRIDVAPDFIAGNLPMDWLGTSRMSYSIFTRNRQQTSLVGRSADPRELVEQEPDTIGAVQGATFEHSTTDTWVGLSWAYPLKTRVGIGISQFVAIRSQKSLVEETTDLFTATQDVSGSRDLVDIGSTVWRLIWKVGLQMEAGRTHLGVTVTTPGVRLYGSGRAAATESRLRDADQQNDEEPVLIATDQNNLSADYRTSWAVGAGVAYRLPRGAIHATAEWFAPVDEYQAIETKSFRSQTGGEPVDFLVVGEQRSVLNAGVGLEYSFSTRVTGYASFRTDFSAIPDESPQNIALSTWDVYHATTGTELHFSSFELTLGAGFSFGGHSVATNVRPLEDLVGEVTLPPLPTGQVSYALVKLLLGFNYYFGGQRAQWASGSEGG